MWFSSSEWIFHELISWLNAQESHLHSAPFEFVLQMWFSWPPSTQKFILMVEAHFGYIVCWLRWTLIHFYCFNSSSSASKRKTSKSFILYTWNLNWMEYGVRIRKLRFALCKVTTLISQLLPLKKREQI